jgi:PASTA domain
LSPKLMQASYQSSEEEESASLEDFTPVDFAAQPDPPPAPEKSNQAEPAKTSVTVALDEGGDIAVPDFHGKTMREVTEMCLSLGLEPVLVGSGLAVDEVPADGAKVRRGAKITVRFGTPEEAASAMKLLGKNRRR